MHRDMDKAWRQMLRWLVTDTPERIETVGRAPAGRSEPGGLARSPGRDGKFQPLDNATLKLTVRPVDPAVRPSQTPGPADPSSAPGVAQTSSVRLNAEPSLQEAGLYEATYVPRETGGYEAEVVVTDPNGIEVGRAVQAGRPIPPQTSSLPQTQPHAAGVVGAEDGGRGHRGRETG